MMEKIERSNNLRWIESSEKIAAMEHTGSQGMSQNRKEKKRLIHPVKH